MVGKFNRQPKGVATYVHNNAWLIVVSVPPSSLGKQEGGLVGSNKSTSA